jgi:hypothetical protein
MSKFFFEKNWKLMVDDYTYDLEHRYNLMHYSVTDAELRDMLLADLECALSINGAHINMFNLPPRTFPNMDTDNNRLIEEELNYAINHLEQEANRLYLFMNNDQKNAFHTIIQNYIRQ